MNVNHKQWICAIKQLNIQKTVRAGKLLSIKQPIDRLGEFGQVADAVDGVAQRRVLQHVTVAVTPLQGMLGVKP